jgi:hypothetical protein
MCNKRTTPAPQRWAAPAAALLAAALFALACSSFNFVAKLPSTSRQLVHVNNQVENY